MLVKNVCLWCNASCGGRPPAQAYIRHVKQHTRRNAVLVGFGISIPDDARTYVKDADGVIIGSALIKRIANGVAGRELSSWIREMKTALA